MSTGEHGEPHGGSRPGQRGGTEAGTAGRGEVDVVVAGYGPMGAVLAALLGQRGLSVVVIEPRPEVYPVPRAVATDAEVLRILTRLPGMGGLPERVNGVQRTVLVGPGPEHRELLQIGFGETDLGTPGAAFFHQPTLERDLRAGVAALPTVEARLGRAVTAVEQDADGVSVRLDDGSRVRASWLVGCDGASSPVRTLLGVPFEGTSFAQPAFVVAVETKAPVPHLPYCTFVLDARRPSVNMPLPGGHVWEWTLLPGEDPAAFSSPEAVRELLRPWVDPDTVRVVAASAYTYATRAARQWRVGRVLLAGDAAHVMPTFGGAGLGAGIRDAAALAWRLGEVTRGLAQERLLDDYERERSLDVARMTPASVLSGRILLPTGPAAALAVRAVLRTVGALPGLGSWLRFADKAPRMGVGGGSTHSHPYAGRLLPNPRVRTLPGHVARLDELLGEGWALLAKGRDPAGDLDPVARKWTRARGASTLALVPPGGLRAAAELPCPAVEDLDGSVLRLLTPRRIPTSRRRGTPAVAVVRPDRRLHGVLPAPLAPPR